MKQLGLLHLRTVGTQRFRIRASHAQTSGLSLAEVDLIDPDEDSPIEPEHKPCADLLARIIDDLSAQLAENRRTSGEDESDAPGGMPFDKPFRMDSSVWVGNRLCEVLPVPLKAKQKLMELEDAHARLEIVSQYLKQHAVLK
jgi:Lon protease-like protein